MAQTVAGIVFDIDGTILRGDQLLPAVHDTLNWLRLTPNKLCFLTNDNRATVQHWLERLRSHDIEVTANEMVTSAVVSAETIHALNPTGNILVVGDDGLWSALEAKGLRLIDCDSDKPAEIVVMGKDPNFNQQTLNKVCQHIWDGAAFYATNNDRKMPVAAGYIPATGAMVQAVAYATGVPPIVTGKPSVYAAAVLLGRMGVSAENTIMVGDSLTSDIKLGKNAGMKTVLVLTGTHSRDDAQKLPPNEQPDYIINTLSELSAILIGETV